MDRSLPIQLPCRSPAANFKRRLIWLLPVLFLFLGLPGVRSYLPAEQTKADNPNEVIVEVAPSSDRQVIDGFGGSLAFWGFDASEEAMRYALEDLGATLVRVPGEASRSGSTDEYRSALARVTRIAPGAKVVLSFWQPRSAEKPAVSDWLDDLGEKGYALKPSMRGAWADEIVRRVRTIRNDWGANVQVVSVQNEPNFSVPGSLTCRWEPPALAEFINDWLAPRLKESGLKVQLAAPDLAFIGDGAAEARRFHVVNSSPDVSIFSYHMYDSYRDGQPPLGLGAMRARQAALGQYLRDQLPRQRVWMTETTGAQWNGKTWHTLGWQPNMDESAKALAAASYLQAALVDAQANAFFWWGLIYSLAPPGRESEEAQKFRDEGLVLVEFNKKDGVHPFAEKTPKYYAFKQFSRFVRPGWVRLDVKASPMPLTAAFRSPDRKQVAIVAINPESAPLAIKPRVFNETDFRLAEVHVTDADHKCEVVPWNGALSGRSVTTLIFQSK